MEASNLWAVASGFFDTCLLSFLSLISLPAAEHNPHPASAWPLQKMSSYGKEDSGEDFSGVGTRTALQPDPHACLLGYHTGLKTSKHAQTFSCTPCRVLFLTFPLRDRSTSEKKIIQLIWSLGAPTKGKNNNSAAALLICIENSGFFFLLTWLACHIQL